MAYSVIRMDAPCWEQVPAVTLTHMPWLEANAIAAQAQLCHNGQTLFLRMEAKEADILARLTGPLDQVCNDSCLEFFFAPMADDPRYLNFEVNPLGNVYLGFGAERPTRVRQIVKKPAPFRTETFRTADGWGFTMEIPLTFIRLYFPDAAFSGKVACNFYKCGDETVSPHYLAWSPLTSEHPDYHRRWDFGEIEFA